MSLEPLLLVGTTILAVLAVLWAVGVTLAAKRRADRGQGSELFRASPMPAVDTPVGTFTVEAVDGTIVTDADLSTGDAVVAFMMAGCSPCTEQRPALVQMLDDMAGRLPAIVVLSGRDDDEAQEELVEIRQAVAGRATLIEADGHSEVNQAFKVDGYPAFLLVRDGRIRVATSLVRQLSAKVTVRA